MSIQVTGCCKSKENLYLEFDIVFPTGIAGTVLLNLQEMTVNTSEFTISFWFRTGNLIAPDFKIEFLDDEENKVLSFQSFRSLNFGQKLVQQYN